MCSTSIVRIWENVTHTVFAAVKFLYQRPVYLVAVSLSIILSMNIYFSVIQIRTGGFIEGDMWFFAYRIEEIAEHGVSALFNTPTGDIDVHPPVYYIFTAPMRRLGLSVPWIAFILRLVIPVTVLYLVYKMTSLLFNTTTAGIACLFIALMPPSGFYHGLWTSTIPTFSLIPFLAGMVSVVKFSQAYEKKWFLLSLLFFLVASFTHLLTAFASFIFLGCFTYFFRNKISKIVVILLGIIFAMLCVYGVHYFATLQSSGMWDIIQNAFSYPPAEIASDLRQLFFIAYWPRHLTLLTSTCFVLAVYHMYHGSVTVRSIDKVFLVWIAILVIYTQVFLLGIHLANQRFLLYLLFGIGIYGAYGFTKLMPILLKRNDAFLEFLIITSIVLFSGYQMGIAVIHYPNLIDASEIDSLNELGEFLPDDALVHIERWRRISRYRFAYCTGHDHIVWDKKVYNSLSSYKDGTKLLSILRAEDIRYIVVSSESKKKYTSLNPDVSVVWNDNQFYLLQVQ